MPETTLETEQILRHLNGIAVTAEDLIQANDAATTAHTSSDTEKADFNGFYVSVSAVGRLFGNDPLKTQAVMTRMQALSRLLSENEMPGWALKQSDDDYSAQEAMFAAAATQPLILVDKQFAFDRDDFLRKTLELAETEGEA